MTYSVKITITRPSKDFAFLPTDAHSQQMQAARKAATGWLREERTHDANTLTIMHVWANKADYDAFETANKVALDAARATRDQHFADHGITSTTTWIDG